MEYDFFTAPEIAALFDISLSTVNRMLNTNKLKGFRLSKNAVWKVTRKEMIRYMKKHNIPLEFLRGNKIKILVVDDEVCITRMIEKTFKDIDKFQIETANSGFIAGAKLESFKPDVIVLDIFLGDMDGREFFEHIQDHPELKKVRVIGITGKLSQGEIQPLLDKGFSAFLQKPFSMNILKETILDVVEK